MMTRWFKIVAALIVLAFLFAAPSLLNSFYLRVMGEVLILAMLAMSINILLGYTGLATLGQAAIFGIGTYVVGYMTTKMGQPFYVTVPAGIIGTLIVAAIFGIFAVRTSGIYFLMITLAQGMIIWGLAFRWNSVTNAENGIRGIDRPEWLAAYPSYYYLVLIVLLIVLALIYRIINSPFGLTLKGIREGERRMLTLGYNTTLHKFLGFMVAAFFAGLAGSLYAFHNNFVSPTTIEFARSAEALLMVILGGTGTMLGPFIGAFVITFGQNQFSLYTDRWPMIMGAIYVITILTAPDGFVGAWRRLYGWLRSSSASSGATESDVTSVTGKEVMSPETLQSPTEASTASSD
ncbi:MAG TPA: branched-chain amino acid ABC transporter permease [Anaerolineae bacterium]|jgi:branched-chain amino acid transport system permease protein